MVKTRCLASTTSTANNIGYQASISRTDFVAELLTAETCKSVLKDRLKLAMTDSFLDFNLQPLLHVLSCIKHSSSFNYHGVMQDFLPAPPAIQAIMKIYFSDDKTSIKVRICRNGKPPLTSSSRKRDKISTKLVDTIVYLEETYKEL